MNEVKIVVTVDGPIGDGFDKTRAKSKTFGDGVKADLDKAAAASKDFDRLVTSNLRDGETAFQSLSRAADDTRNRYEQLRQEFARTGSSASFGELKQAETDFKLISAYIEDVGGKVRGLNQPLQNLSKPVKDLNKTGKDANDIFSIFSDQLGFLASKGPAIGALVVALSPLLGAVVGGSALSLLAGGGLAAGIVTQFGSPEVQGALSQFENKVVGTWNKATEAFGPATAQALDHLGADLQPVVATVGKAVNQLAPFVDGIFKAFGQFGQILGKDLAGDLGKMEPIFTALERSIPVVAQGIGEFFNDISDHAPEIANDIETIAHGVETLMNVTGHVVGFLAADFAGIHALYQLATGDLTGFVQTIGDATSGGAVAITRFGQINQVEKELGSATDDLASSYAQLAAEMHNTFTESMSLDQSQVEMYKAINDLKDALKQNKGQWDITTAAGEAHRLKLLAAIQKTEEYYTWLGKVNGITPALAKSYKDQIDALITLAAKAGLSADQVAALKTQFDNLLVIMDKVNNTPVTVRIDTVRSGASISTTSGGRRGHGHAAGGIASGLTWVGEQGAELVRLPQGSMVYPAGQSAQMAAAGVGGVAGGVGRLQLDVAPTAQSAFAGMVLNMFRTGQIRLTVRDPQSGKNVAVTVSGG